MCKRTTSERVQDVERRVAYEGPTTRLSQRDTPGGSVRKCGSHAWQWHLLWLLWPLLSLAKWLSTQAEHTIAATLGVLVAAAPLAASLAGIALIVVGLALIRRSR